ncbi:hypothetical protein LCGC14_2542550, partial [marine sediment metagenome]
DQVIRYLNHAFISATQGIGKATRTVVKKKVVTTLSYDLQVKFAYMINDIGNGPKYLIPKVIAEANEFIREINEIRGS